MAEDVFTAGKIDEEKEKIVSREAEEAKQRRINYGLTFSTMEGFEVIKDIMAFCHANAISHGFGDAYQTAFREGERNVFLYILSQLSDEMKQKLSIGG